jgi:hypothetical protein
MDTLQCSIIDKAAYDLPIDCPQQGSPRQLYREASAMVIENQKSSHGNFGDRGFSTMRYVSFQAARYIVMEWRKNPYRRLTLSASEKSKGTAMVNGCRLYETEMQCNEDQKAGDIYERICYCYSKSYIGIYVVPF